LPAAKFLQIYKNFPGGASPQELGQKLGAGLMGAGWSWKILPTWRSWDAKVEKLENFSIYLIIDK